MVGSRRQASSEERIRAGPRRPRARRIAALGGVALAQAQQISDEQARRIALEHVPGTVLELERDDEDGTPEIEVEVRGEDGRVHEVTIDARDGRVIAIEEEDDD